MQKCLNLQKKNPLKAAEQEKSPFVEKCTFYLLQYLG